MAAIFISYTRQDREWAQLLADTLQSHGWSVWWDRKISPGKKYEQEIQNALDEAKCVIVLWSKESVQSDYVKDEALEGLSRNAYVPVLIEEVRIPLGFRQIHAARLIDWKGELKHADFEGLLSSLNEIIGYPKSKIPPEPFRIENIEASYQDSIEHKEPQEACSYETLNDDAEIKKILSKPPWATAITRDGEHLYATLLDKRQLLLLNPGSYALNLKDKTAEIAIDKGFWWDSEGFFDWCKNTFSKLNWADLCSMDEYGIYSDFFVRHVKQRMRWIWPGTFMMGRDPEKESGGLYETLHEVILTRGFWLAETACTQELWCAIMGDNPSEFKGENLPVERVSWEDCQLFLQTINERKPGLDLRLPTEAEWEYACRAGTTTPFSFGEDITTDQVNYDGNIPLGSIIDSNKQLHVFGEKGECRKKTVAVKSFPCNAWGLYEMHGNVGEWCNDWNDSSCLSESMIDPIGPDTASYRVIRDGSWYSTAGDCRSACRHHGLPDHRSNHRGFRFARGQKVQ